MVNIGCHFKRPLKQHRSGECFPDDDAVERVVCTRLRQQPKEFYAAGLQGLVKRRDKCLNFYGDYVESEMFLCNYQHSFLFNHEL